ncbi:isopeptide-forming domain-containing fimbrial protein [Vagococcus fluvialis]|uniref:isopeptide-forming domain-containing fimbrial protein n=1 Tax=Vagococcus fluvialis TaxID=2738 RepID=UPI003D11D867
MSERNEKVLFADMSNQNHDLKEIRIPNIDDYDHVVIYSNQSAIRFANGSIVLDGKPIDTGKPQNQELYDLAGKLTWVLPNMTDIKIERYGMIGDIYAHNATVDTKGGSVNGSLYVNNLISNGGFEVHNFRSKPVIPEKPEVTEPSTTELIDPVEPIEPRMGEFRATKVVDKKEAKLGDIFAYTITAENIVKDSIEAEIDGKHVEFDKDKIETIGNKAKVSFKELKGGQKISISLKAKVTDKAVENIVNIALVEGENPEKPGEPVEPAKPKEEVPVKPTEPEVPTTKVGKLEANKVADKKQVKVGEKLTYTIAAKTVVPESKLSKVIITDELPESLDLVGGSLLVKVNGQEFKINQEDIEINGNHIKVTFRNVIGNQEIEISFQATVNEKSKDSVLNTALVEGVDEEPIAL